MKKLTMTLALIAAIGAFAQSTSSSKSTSRTTTSGSTISSESSITRSSDSYQFEARFDEDKHSEVRRILQERLSPSYLTDVGSAYEWEREVGGRTYFNCRLTENKLRLSLNLELSSDDFYDLIDELGDDLRDIIQKHETQTWTPMIPSSPSPPANPNSTDPQLLDQELREAERELARAQRNVERLRKKKGN
ncbi:MAG: hypothetical protein ABJG47_10105 [Ekhidna sp.]